MESNKEEQITTVSEENIYKLNGRVPLRKAIPFGLQHVLAMFVSNLAPVLIVCSAAVLRSNGAHLSSAEITQLLQCAMFVAGIGTCLQLYPIGVIGSGLPIIMGVSFTFLGSLLVIATNPDLGYEAMAGAVILGGIFEGFVGLSAKYWRKYLTPVVSAALPDTGRIRVCSYRNRTFVIVRRYGFLGRWKWSERLRFLVSSGRWSIYIDRMSGIQRSIERCL